jgi:hypothetical protein
MAAEAKPAMTMAAFAESITDMGDSIPSVNLGFHGVPGCGKTALLSALPDTLMLAFDPGWVTAKKLRRDCRLVHINSYEKLMAGVLWLEDGGYEGYRWILADGCSILQTRLLQQFGREAWEANPEKRVSAFQPDKPDYFKQQNVFKSVVARLCDLPTNVVFTFHSTMGDDGEGDTWYRPHIDGRDYKVGNFVCGLMSSIAYMGVAEIATENGGPKKQIRRLLWQQHRNEDKGISYLAKDQLNVFPRVMDEPTAELIDKMALSDADETPVTTTTRRKTKS